jgi:hypothetical protein
MHIKLKTERRSTMDLKTFIQQDVRVVCTVEDVLEFGRSQHYEFFLMEEKGVLTEPIQRENWKYQEWRNSIMIPGFARDRLTKVQKQDYPILQVIYGEELEIEKPAEIDLKRYVKPALTGLGVLALGAIAVGSIMAMTAATFVDPRLIIVLDDGSPPDQAPWICLVSWVK